MKNFKGRSLFFRTVFSGLLFVSCQQNINTEFTSISPTAAYKLVSFSTQANTIEDGDLTEFRCIMLKNNRDTLFPDSARLNELFNDTITYRASSKSDLLRIIGSLQEGDSCIALFYNSANTSGLVNQQTSKVSEKDTIYCYIKLKHVYKGKEKMAYLLEEHAIARYITFSKQAWQATENGIFYRIITPSQHGQLVFNDPIKLVYTGYFLNGQIFDNYAAINPYFEYKVGTQNQLISGMELAIKYMSYGSEAEFIFPSSLAFGKQGSSTGIVPAYKPLLYKVKILEKESLN